MGQYGQPGASGAATRWRVSTLVIVMLLSNAVLPAVAADTSPSSGNPVVVLTELSAPAQNVIAQRIAGSITSSLALLLRLTGTVKVDRADFIAPNRAYRRAVIYYTSTHAQVAVFGTVQATSGGGYRVHIRVWSPTVGSGKPAEITRSIKDVLSVFDIADRLALDVGSRVVGRKLQAGELIVQGTGRLNSFSVYADGQLLGRNQTRYRVLAGRRTVIVAIPGPLGDQPLQRFSVSIPPRGTTTIRVQTPQTAKRSGLGGTARRAPTIPPRRRKTGRLQVSSVPSGAAVYLDRKLIGKTPLRDSLVGAGTHTLTLEHPYLHSVSRVVLVQEEKSTRTSVQMQTDQSDPAVKQLLVSPIGATIAAGSWSILQAGMVLGPLWVVGSLGGILGSSVPDMLAFGVDGLGVHIGHRYARDRRSSLVLDLIGASATAVFVYEGVASALGRGNGAAAGTIALIAIGGDILSALYDISFAASAAKRTNARTLAYIDKHGMLPRVIAPRAHRWILESGGGAVARFGYRFPLLPGYLSVEIAAGLSAATLAPFRPAASGVARLVLTPFGRRTGRVRPALFAVAEGESDLSQYGLSIGGGIGADLVLRHFDIVTRYAIGYGLVTGTEGATFTLGGRF